ncbi:nucleotidyltransferase domain-containing protein [Oceanobacillus sp. M65]|uniref:nucleotidyltransferase domain-containing protein n=1 Tax=Oceanobacillus sp. M65 TaxID=3457435 RepID=UPI003FCCA5A7
METLRTGYGIDANGFIISDVSTDKIDTVYMPSIQESVERLRRMFPQKLHSVYVYGSVARGEAILIESDLDLIAMFVKKLNSDELVELKKLTEVLSQKYQDLVREVGIAIADYDYTMDPSSYFENAFLKKISVCVYGEDVGDHFGPYKLTAEIPISFNGDIGDSLKRALNKLEAPSNQDFNITSQGFARKLIRTYYSMVMVRSQIWTTRLQQQAQVFLQYFPDKEPIVQTLLNWVSEPPTNRKYVYALFKKEGEWARDNFAKEVIKSSYSKE